MAMGVVLIIMRLPGMKLERNGWLCAKPQIICRRRGKVNTVAKGQTLSLRCFGLAYALLQP